MEEFAPLALDFEPRLEPAVRAWARLTPWQRRGVTLDDFAAHAGLAPGEFLSAIARVAFETTENIADLIVACSLPKMVHTSVKRALTPEGFEDRLMLLKKVGFLDGPPPMTRTGSEQGTLPTPQD